MRKDIFESEEELIAFWSECTREVVVTLPFRFMEIAKENGFIKQSPLEKLSDAWNIFYSQRYTYRIKPSDRGVVENNDQWVNAATDVITAQEKVIEYLKQKLEEQK